jgi:predicted MFS family arabinose efflux permease
MLDPLVHRRRWWILLVLIVALFTVNLDNTIINVALPTLARVFSADMSQLQWIIDGYVLPFAGLLLAAGALGDRFGRRRVMLVGLVLFGAGSAASAFAPSAEALILLRAVMGVGGALIVPSTLSVTATVFSIEERPKAIGIWTAVAGLGIVAGPVLAGWMLQHLAWGSILIYAVIEAPSNGWTSPEDLASFGLAAALMVAFVARERMTPEPLIDVRLLARPAFGSAVLAVLLTSFGLFGSMFFFTQYLQGVLGFSTIQTGFSILPLAIALAIASPTGMPLSRRVGTRATVAVGMAIVAVGLLVFRMAGVTDGYPYAAATLALVGAGMGLAMGPLTVIMVRTLPIAKQGVASAMNSTARELGGALGVAILGSLAAPVYTDGVRPATTLLPPQAAAAVGDSLAGAGAVAAQLPGIQASAILDLARASFVDAMAVAVLVGAGVALVGASVALALLPGRTAAVVGERPATTAPIAGEPSVAAA